MTETDLRKTLRNLVFAAKLCARDLAETLAEQRYARRKDRQREWGPESLPSK